MAAKKAGLTENATLMTKARESLAGKWGLAVTASLIIIAISIAASIPKYVGWLISFVIGGPLALGVMMFWLNLSRGKEAKVEQIFSGFDRFKTSFLAYLLTVIFILLWALLLIIPGIMAAFSYSQTFFILADDKSIDARSAIQKSKKMMQGRRWKLFCLYCRFIGWGLLCILTLGIGFIWLYPYMSMSVAKFYDDVRASA